MKWPLFTLTLGSSLDISIDANKYYYIEFTGDTKFAYNSFYNDNNVEIKNKNIANAELLKCCKYIKSNL